jgi:hypothetical protein
MTSCTVALLDLLDLEDEGTSVEMLETIYTTTQHNVLEELNLQIS